MKKTAVLTIILVLALTPALFSQMGRGMMANNPDQLTSEQMTKIKQMNLNYQKELIPIRMKLQEKNLELTNLMADMADQKTIESKIEEMSAIYADLLKKSVEHRSNILGVLTDEQKEMFNWNMGFGMGMGPGMMGMMGQGPGMMGGAGMGMMSGMMGSMMGCGMMGGMGPWKCPYCGMLHW
jgi:hypothetical protein